MEISYGFPPAPADVVGAPELFVAKLDTTIATSLFPSPSRNMYYGVSVVAYGWIETCYHSLDSHISRLIRLRTRNACRTLTESGTALALKSYNITTTNSLPNLIRLTITQAFSAGSPALHPARRLWQHNIASADFYYHTTIP